MINIDADMRDTLIGETWIVRIGNDIKLSKLKLVKMLDQYCIVHNLTNHDEIEYYSYNDLTFIALYEAVRTPPPKPTPLAYVLNAYMGNKQIMIKDVYEIKGSSLSSIFWIRKPSNDQRKTLIAQLKPTGVEKMVVDYEQ